MPEKIDDPQTRNGDINQTDALSHQHRSGRLVRPQAKRWQKGSEAVGRAEVGDPCDFPVPGTGYFRFVSQQVW